MLEVRPPVPVDKGQAVRDLVEQAGRARPSTAATTPPTSTRSTRSTRWWPSDALDAAVRVGVRSDEGPAAIVERADLVVDGVEGFTRVLAALAEA